MQRFRCQKQRLAEMCARQDWKNSLDAEINDVTAARRAVNPLLALLPRPEFRWQAAYGLGLCLPLMAEDDMESARVFMRRLMWGLNEDSGNLGWGIPEAMGAILGQSPALAGEYARIFFSYGYETGKADNFLDHIPLRRGVYWGIGRLAQGNPAAALPALALLAQALRNEDTFICGMAGWAMGQLAANSPQAAFTDAGGREMWLDAGKRLREEKEKRTAAGRGGSEMAFFNGDAVVTESLAALLDTAILEVEGKL